MNIVLVDNRIHEPNLEVLIMNINGRQLNQFNQKLHQLKDMENGIVLNMDIKEIFMQIIL
jgi:hypothetical protein